MKIEKLQDITSQKGYKINDQFFVAYEENFQFDSSNEDYKDCLQYIKNGGIVLPEFTNQEYLNQAKNKKLADLSKFYDSSECWTYTLFSNLTKTYASLTRDADFFAKLLPCCGGKTIQFLDDQNKVVNYSLTIEKADNLNYKINVNNSTTIRVKKLELENKIAIANTIEIIDSIDFKTELLNAVERNIDLDKFN